MATDHGRPAQGWSCPAPEILAAYADGRIDDIIRAKFERHLADCDACLADVGLLVRAADVPPSPVPDALLHRASQLASPTKPLRRAWIAAAAGSVLAASVLLVQQRGPAVQPVTPGSGVRGLAATDLQVIEPMEGGRFSRDAAVVRWLAVPRTLFYEIRLTDPDGALVWEARTQVTEISIPPEALRPFSSGFLWVTAHQPDNRSVRSRAVAVGVTK